MRPVDYPRASLERSLELAAAIHALGGDCSLEAAAGRLGARVGGAFHATVSAAGRFGFVSVRRGRARTEPAFREYRLSYDSAERHQVLTRAVANVPLFRRLIERFAGKPLPEGRLDRVLVREYGVPEHSAERVARYFVDAARAAGLLQSGLLQAPREPLARDGEPPEPRHERAGDAVRPTASREARPTGREPFRVHVQGPGLDTLLEVAGPADLELVRALVAKLERALRDER